MTVTVIRHTIYDTLGCFAPPLEQAGETVVYVEACLGEMDGFDPFTPGPLIVLGGSPGVYQADLYPFLKQEIACLEKRLAADLPTLGVCLGAQIMAKALGANVYKGGQGPENGWRAIDVNQDGRKTPVRHFDREWTRIFQWHGDTFDLPDGATLLASSENYRQAFSWGRNALAVQFHPEITSAMAKSWLVDAAGAAASGRIDIEKIRGDCDHHAETMVRQSGSFMLEWLAHVKEGKAVAGNHT